MLFSFANLTWVYGTDSHAMSADLKSNADAELMSIDNMHLSLETGQKFVFDMLRPLEGQIIWTNLRRKKEG